MKKVTIETTDHSYQGKLVSEDTNQLLVSYLDENRERVQAWYNKDICEVELVSPRSSGYLEATVEQQQALYLELVADGYVLLDDQIAIGTAGLLSDEELGVVRKHRWTTLDGKTADYLCQFEQDGIKYYLPNDEEWFDIIAVDHEHKLAIHTGHCEYHDIEGTAEYRHTYHDGKLVIGFELPQVKPLVLAEVKIESQYPVQWLKLSNEDYQIVYGAEIHTYDTASKRKHAGNQFAACVAHAIESNGGFLPE